MCNVLGRTENLALGVRTEIFFNAKLQTQRFLEGALAQAICRGTRKPRLRFVYYDPASILLVLSDNKTKGLPETNRTQQLMPTPTPRPTGRRSRCSLWDERSILHF